MIELSKGQELALIGDDGHPLTRLKMGVGWDRARNAGFIGSGAPDIDLDASAVSFGDGQLLDAAFYNNLESRDGSVVHLGDNLTAHEQSDRRRCWDVAADRQDLSGSALDRVGLFCRRHGRAHEVDHVGPR